MMNRQFDDDEFFARVNGLSASVRALGISASEATSNLFAVGNMYTEGRRLYIAKLGMSPDHYQRFYEALDELSQVLESLFWLYTYRAHQAATESKNPAP